MDSNSEESDSDLSDVGEVDSDLEREKQVKYDRAVYREDAAALKKLSKKMAPGQKRKQGPNDGLKLEFVHGFVSLLTFSLCAVNSTGVFR